MNIDLKFSKKQQEMIQEKFIEYADELLTDEYLKGIFDDILKTSVKSAVNEVIQHPDFRNMIKQRVMPQVFEVFGREMMIGELKK